MVLQFDLVRLDFILEPEDGELVAFYNNFVIRIIVHIRILLFKLLESIFVERKLVLLPYIRLDVMKDILKSL
jgi:hypothetical protein